MKDTINTLVKISAVFCGVMLIIHRRVIAAAFTGTKMPEAPQWHKKVFSCLKKKSQ